jgi:hypothetical protein
MLDEILNHTLTVAKRGNLVSYVNYASDLFQVEVSHLYNPKTLEFMLIMYILLSPMPTCLNLVGPHNETNAIFTEELYFMLLVTLALKTLVHFPEWTQPNHIK